MVWTAGDAKVVCGDFFFFLFIPPLLNFVLFKMY